MGPEDNLVVATPTTYTLSVRTWNQYAVGHWAPFRAGGINFTIDGNIYTSPVALSLPEGLHTIEMPLKWNGCSWYSGCGQFTFIQWENYGDLGWSEDRIRAIDLTANMTINAAYWLKTWGLTVNSYPISGINFTIDGGDPRSTPWSSFVSEGTHAIAVSSNWTVDPNYYNFVRWEEDSTEPTRTIFVTEDTTITATYLQPTPAEFTFTDLIISTEEVTVGEDYNVSATATNVGDLEGYCDVSLTVNGVLDDVKTISLAGGESTTIVFTLTATTAGKPITMMFIVAIDGLEGTVIINPTPDSNILYVALTALIASAVAIVVIIRHLNRRRPTGLRRWKEQA
jgi:hypothetical protein